MNKGVLHGVVIVCCLFIIATCSINIGEKLRMRVMTNSNRQTGPDPYQTFNYALVRNEAGSFKEVAIKSWRDFDNPDCTQIVTTNDIVYLSDYSNIILVHKPEK